MLNSIKIYKQVAPIALFSSLTKFCGLDFLWIYTVTAILLFLCLFIIYTYIFCIWGIKRKILLCASPLLDQETLTTIVNLSKQGIYYGTALGSLYNKKLLTPIGTVKGFDVFMTVGGVGISKSYFNDLLHLKLAVNVGPDGKERVGFWFTYGASPKFKTIEESFYNSFICSLKNEKVEVLKRIDLLEKTIVNELISEEEKSAAFISKEVYLRRLSDNEETLYLLSTYLGKRKKGKMAIEELGLPGNLGYSSKSGLGVSYNEHFLNVCLENKDLYNGPFRRFWQERDCQHFHKKGDIDCLTGVRAKNFELSLEPLNESSGIIPYSYNLIKVLEEFKAEYGYYPHKLTPGGKSFCEDPEGYMKSGRHLLSLDTRDQLSAIWEESMKKGSIFYDICIQDSLTPDSPLDLRGGFSVRAVGLLLFFTLGYLDNSSSIYFNGLYYKPVEVARDIYNKKEYGSFFEVFPYRKVIYLKKEIKYKVRL
jgi:hypothetical protein